MANSLPTVSSPLPRDLQQFIQRVREAIDGGGPDAVLTARQLIASGIAVNSGGGGVAPVVGTVQAPRAPTAVSTEAALASVFVTWGGPGYTGHAYSEVWAHTADVVGDATLVGMTPGNIFAHSLGGSASRYYWVKNVNRNGVASSFNATNGVQGATGQDAGYLLSLLAGELTFATFGTDLSERISLIDAASTVTGSVNARIATETAARTSSVNSLSSVVSQLTGTGAYDATVAYSVNDLVTYNSNLYKALQSTTGNLPTNTTYWDLVGNYSSISQVVVANSAAISNTDGRVGNNTSAIQSEETARTSADSAVASRVDVLAVAALNSAASIETEGTARSDADEAVTAQLTTAISQQQNTVASVLSEQTTRAAVDEATTSQLVGAISEVQTNTAAISSELITRSTNESAVAAQLTGLEATASGNTAAIAAELNTRADGDSATAAQTTGLSAVVRDNISAIAVQTEASSDADSANAAQASVISSTVSNTQAAISAEASTRADDDSATASQVTTIQSTVGGNTASIQQQSSSIDGLQAQYTVKIDNNGHVAGFGLASTTVDGARVSDFIVAADRFSVVNPTETFDIDVSYTGSATHRRYIQVSLSVYNAYTYVAGDTLTVREMGVYSREYNITGKGNIISPNLGYVLEITRTSNYPGTLIDFPVQSSSWFTANYPNANAGINLEVKSPFVISTGSTQINGVAVPAGTYIDSAMIADATINNAQINNLTADKITASLLNTVDFYGNTIAGSTIYLGGTITYTTDSVGNNIGIASVASPKVVMASTGATFAVDAFTIDNPNGTDATPFSVTNNVVNIDTALIADGTITNAMIGDTIQSTNYSDANNTGWKLEKNGNLDLNSASITAGTLQSTDGNFVIDLTNGTITISA